MTFSFPTFCRVLGIPLYEKIVDILPVSMRAPRFHGMHDSDIPVYRDPTLQELADCEATNQAISQKMYGERNGFELGLWVTPRHLYVFSRALLMHDDVRRAIDGIGPSDAALYGRYYPSQRTLQVWPSKWSGVHSFDGLVQKLPSHPAIRALKIQVQVTPDERR